MFIKNKYFCIVFLILSFSFSNELLFNDDQLFDNYAISLGGTAMFSCNECRENDGRAIGNLNRLNMSLLIKANHRINLGYYYKADSFYGFNLPYDEVGSYYEIGTQHFMKNKTPLNLNFDLFINFMLSDENSYRKYDFGCGISKSVEMQNFQSFIRFSLNIYDYNSNAEDLGDGGGWSFGIDYPIYMRVLPSDNVPSKISYILTPRLVLDVSDANPGPANQDVYFNCSFDISYAF